VHAFIFGLTLLKNDHLNIFPLVSHPPEQQPPKELALLVRPLTLQLEFSTEEGVLF
jgi:hypothetical protein